MIRVRKVEDIIPPIIVQPKGDHKLVAESVNGSNPKIVVVVVRIIGTNRVAAPSRIASSLVLPCAIN